MSATSRVLVRVFSEVVTEEYGSKKWRRIVRETERRLREGIPDNGIGPEVVARRDALQIVLSARRLCVVDRRAKR